MPDFALMSVFAAATARDLLGDALVLGTAIGVIAALHKLGFRPYP